MRLLINTASTYKGGSVQNAKSFIEECVRFPENEYHVILSPSLADKISYDLFPDNFFFYHIGYRPATKVFSLHSASSFFEKLEKTIKPDVVFTTSGPAYWQPKVPHLTGYNLPHYIYPESPFFRITPWQKKIKWKLKGLLIKYYFKNDSDVYVVQTEDVNRRLRKWLKTDKVFTVSNTCNAYYFNPPKFPPKLPPKRDNEFRLLLFSGYYRHKNFEIIPGVIDELPENYRKNVRFVLTLEPEVYKRIFPERYFQNIFNIGPVKVEEGPSLYQECDALFLPTLLECFSASYPEAMAMEKPIITSDLDFAHSICKDAAVYFDPLDPKDIAQKIITLMDDSNKQQRLINNGKKRLEDFLTPEERAKAYLKICERIVEK